jgi:uncharacterized protein (DUF433 family)
VFANRSFAWRDQPHGWMEDSTVELPELEQKLGEALQRIEQLEEQLQAVQESQRWSHLIARPGSWRRQLSLKERNMTIGQLVSTMRANGLTPEEASEDMELPLAAIHEALEYYEKNQELIQREAAEERRYLNAKGYALEPKDLSR